MAIKVKQVFPSRNYITIDCKGDIKVVFNPVGNGTEGDDELLFRAGRWAFRVNDFLAGKMMPNGDKESMNRKIYSLNIVYNDEDGEPVVTTTYVDPTSVITLDGSRVSINGFNEMATLEAQSQIKSLMATKAKQTDIINAINAIDLSNLATYAGQTDIKAVIQDTGFSVAKENRQKAITEFYNAFFDYSNTDSKGAISLNLGYAQQTIIEYHDIVLNNLTIRIQLNQQGVETRYLIFKNANIRLYVESNSAINFEIISCDSVICNGVMYDKVFNYYQNHAMLPLFAGRWFTINNGNIGIGKIYLQGLNLSNNAIESLAIDNENLSIVSFKIYFNC